MYTRFDERTKKQFKKDIKQCHIKEAEIAVKLAIAVHAKTKEWPEIKGLGIDHTGGFIENDKDVTAEPDYMIGDRMVEITHSNTFCKKIFHEKCNKVDRMLREGTDMVFVNGYGVMKQPEFIWLKASTWEPFVQRSKSKYGIVPMLGGGKIGFLNKNAYRFDTYWFQDLWRPLPVLIKSVPASYKKLIEEAKS